MSPCRRYASHPILLGLAAILGITLFSASALLGGRHTAVQTDFFESKVRPLLAKNCYQCHSELAKILYSNFRLDGRDALLDGGVRGPAIVPGHPESSQLIQAVRYENLKMPPAGRLSGDQIETLVKWVEMGAPWPDLEVAVGIKTSDGQHDLSSGQSHWAWKPVQKVSPPTVLEKHWPAHPIDNFILKKLEAEDLAPSSGADRHTLLRRVYFDLIGLTPKSEDVKSFVTDDSERAFEKVVDQLLKSPGFGERWGRHWLDLTSYADSLGQGRRIPAREAWRYRDYVINAFNANKPYDRFVQEQISGDVLPWKTDDQRREQLVATGFLAIGPWAVVDSDKEKLRMDVVDHQLDTLGRALQGLTLGCARCHDHKFDPIPTREYYALAGIFRSTRTLNGRMSGGFSDVNRVLLPETPSEMRKRALATEEYQQTLDRFLSEYEAVESEKKRLTDRQKALEEGRNRSQGGAREKELKEIDKKLKEAKDRIRLLEFRRPGPPMAIAVQDRPVPKDCRVNIGGDPHNLGEEVPRGFLSVASPAKAGRIDSHRNLKGLYEGFQKSSGRLELAEWLIDPQNRLLARVMVNRIWHHLFGAGLVRTVDNFGAGGEPPSHPELLDYLASRFVELGWSVKGMIREIVLTRTYRQASRHNLKGHEVDPDNRLLWRANRRRLEAEAYRDSVLAISGALDRTRGGPTLPLDIPESIALGFPTALTQDAKVNDEFLNRRTIYLPSVRKNQLPQLDLLNLFDFPDPDQTIGARSVTTVPTQSLYLMNSPFLREQALLTARTLLEAGGPDDKTRVSDFFLQALNRPATEQEVDQALDFIAKFQEKLGRLPEASGNLRLKAWARYCHSVFASNEFLFRG